MIDSGFFMAIAGLGVSIAGFAAIMYSFRRSGDLSRLTAWRIRYIVTGGFSLSAASIGVVVVGIGTDDPDLQVRLASVLGMLTWVPSSWTFRSVRDPEIFRTRVESTTWVGGSVLYEALHVVNLFVASYLFLVALWALMVAAAMSIFVAEIGSIYRVPLRSSRTGTEATDPAPGSPSP